MKHAGALARSAQLVLAAKVAIFLLMLPSCVVGPQGYYYKPSIEDSAATYDGLWNTNCGPPGKLDFPIGNHITSRVCLIADDRRKSRLHIELDIPRGVSIQLITDEVRFVESESRDQWIQKWHGVDTQLHESAADLRWPRFIDINREAASEIEVHLPAMRVNGKRISVKPITFKKQLGFGVIPFNC